MPALHVNVSARMHEAARSIAEQRRETVSDVVRHALAEYLAEARELAEDARRVEEVEARIATGEERIYTHAEVWAELDNLEAQGALPA